MKVGAAIYSMLKNDGAVSALVGTRIYPELAEEGAQTPYVVYSVVSNTPVDTKDSAPVDEAQLEVFSVANTYAAANDLADKVRSALSRKSKLVYKTVTVQSIKYTNEVTEVSAERNLFISVQDYTARLTPVMSLLDLYRPAAGAYSLRRLREAYTGPAIRVRIPQTNDETDIGFDGNGNLDTTALTTFAGSYQTIRVKTWYDQGGLGRDAIQGTSAEQPIIIENGDVVQQNGKPALKFDGEGTYLHASTIELVQPITASFVAQATLDGTPSYIYDGDDSDRVAVFKTYSDGWTAYAGASLDLGTDNDTNNQILGTVLYDAANSLFYINGTQAASGQLSTGEGTGIFIGARYNDDWHLNGTLQELIFWNLDQSANRTGIESNIMTHYSIT